MKTFITAAALAASVSAAVLHRQDQCCFQLTASGGQSGQVGQLSDGQNRIGGSYPAGTYCLSDGTITDGNGRGCILTPPTTQFQCDEGATPDSGFSVSGSGELQHDGDSTFYACAAADGEYNVYTSTSGDQTLCSKITLSTGGECDGSEGGAASSTSAASQPAGSSASSPSGYSPPASSPAGPESTAPATSEASVPGYSAPVPSAPAQSAPAPAPSVSTRMVTIYSTVCGCESESAPAGVPSSAPGVPSSAPGAPSSTWGYPAPSGGAPAPSAPAPVPSSYSAPFGSQPAPAPIVPAPSSYAAPSGSAPAPSGPAPAPSSYSKPAPSQPAPVPSQSSPASAESSAPGYSFPSGSAPAPSSSAPESSSTPSTTPIGYTQPIASTQPAASPSPSTGTASGSACQTSLVPGSYETPHLIIPVSSNSPDESYGTSYNAYISSANSTIFNFDIPASDAGKTCTLVFLFPKKEDLETTDYTFNGQGSLDFAQLSGAVDESTTYNSCPSKQQDLGSVTPVPGGSYVVQSGACAPGTMETVEMSASGGLELEFFEDWNPSPLGLFITVC